MTGHANRASVKGEDIAMRGSRRIPRRAVLQVGAAAAALPLGNIGLAGENRVLRFIPSTDLTVLDPHWSGTYVTRNHGYLVFDTLFGTDNGFQPQPQMVDGTVTEADGKRWTLTLREGLKFHDGEPVLAIEEAVPTAAERTRHTDLAHAGDTAGAAGENRRVHADQGSCRQRSLSLQGG
jgi:hypothetical protein